VKAVREEEVKLWGDRICETKMRGERSDVVVDDVKGSRDVKKAKA